MRSDETVMLTPELVFNGNGNGNGVRLFAYSSAICGKEGSAFDKKAKNGSGATGLMKELEKTKLDA